MPPAERTEIASRRFGRFAERRSRGQRLFDRLDDRRRLGHPARTEFAAGHRPRFGADEQNAVLLQAIEVASGRRVQPHPARSSPGRQARACRSPARAWSPDRRRGRAAIRARILRARRRDHDEVGGARQLDMADRASSVRLKRSSRTGCPLSVAADRGRYELLGRRGHDDAHRRAAVPEPPDQLQRLVGRDSSTDDQENTRARERDDGHPMTLARTVRSSGTAPATRRIPCNSARNVHLSFVPLPAPRPAVQSAISSATNDTRGLSRRLPKLQLPQLWCWRCATAAGGCETPAGRRPGPLDAAARLPAWPSVGNGPGKRVHGGSRHSITSDTKERRGQIRRSQTPENI